MIVVTAAQMQSMDRRTIEEVGIPGRVLMENAGRGATRSFLRHLYRNDNKRVGILAGRGNNGGDGFVIARYLACKGIDVTVYLLAKTDRVQGDAAANLNLLPAAEVPVIEIPDEQQFSAHRSGMQHVAYWIDAMLGTGLTSEVRGYYRAVIDFINQMERPVMAVDIPSGLNADTGQPWGVCIRADATATFGFAKIGHLLHPGVQYCGAIDLIDIGIPPSVTAEDEIRQYLICGEQIGQLLDRRSADIHKGRTGHVLVVAGATGKTGAASMAATSVMRSGAGLVTLGIPQSLNPILESQVTEAMTLPLPDQGTGLLLEEAFDPIVKAAESKQAMAIGPGLGTAAHTRNLISRMIKEIDLPLVIDADGLNNLSGHMGWIQGRRNATVLTPHPGEMARLTGMTVSQIQQDRITAARNLSTHSQALVVLKGARTVIAAPDGRVWINPTGNSGMASGGMGDVLTGLITGLLAQGYSPTEACRSGVYLHGLAADILSTQVPWGYLATEVMNTVPQAIQRVITKPPADPIRKVFC